MPAWHIMMADFHVPNHRSTAGRRAEFGARRGRAPRSPGWRFLGSAAVLVLITAGGLAGCGIKGPLYLPQTPPPSQPQTP